MARKFTFYENFLHISILPVYLLLIFEIFSSMNLIFFSILNLITACVACKIEFEIAKNSISNSSLLNLIF